jgi:aqualysin 1
MRRPLLRGYAVGLVLAALSFGCSQERTQPTNPTPDGSFGPAPLINASSPAEAVPGSYIVVFKETVPDVNSAVDEISLRPDVTTTYRYEHALKGFAANLSPSAVEALRNDPRVAYIEQDQIAHAVGTQTNPPSWGLDRVDQRALPRDNSYTYNQTGAGVDAYIIDTGIRFTHTDFGGRAVTGVDEITIGGTAADGNGHGTHVAGSVGGASYGMAKAIRLIAVRVLNNQGSGTYTQVIAGVDWVTGDHTTRPAVANMSLSGPVSSALDQAVRNSIADGVVYCVAAGNNATNVNTASPADVAEAMTVAASASNDAWASYSNYGSGVDIIAPGSSITSAWYTSDTATNTISGTSMATPHVAGAAALYLEANPGSTPAQVASGLVSISTAGAITGRHPPRRC